MNLFQHLNPVNSPSYLKGKQELDVYRERVLQTILLASIGIAVFLYIQAIVISISQNNYYQVVYSTIFILGLLFLAFFRNVNYRIRASIVIILLIAWSAVTFIENGVTGPSFLILLAATVLAGILLGQIASVITLIVSTLIIILFAAGMAGGYFNMLPPWAPMETQNVVSWTRMGSNYLLLAIGITISIIFLISRLQSNLDRETSQKLEIEDERINLEQHIQDRTLELEKRIYQIRTAADISRSISSTLDRQTLLQQVVDLIQENFKLYYVGVFIVNKNAQYAVLQAGTGSAGRKMVSEGHRLQVGGQSMIGWTTKNQESRIALDVGNDAVRFNNPYLPDTRSELAIPIINRLKILGALSIQSNQSNAFDEGDILILQGIADSLAIALANAALFEQSQRNIDEISSLNRHYLSNAWTEITNNNGALNYTYENPIPDATGPIDIINLPITLRDQSIGAFAIETPADQSITDEDREMIESIINQTALSLESARLLAETERKAKQEGKLNDLASIFSHSVNIEELLKGAITELGQLPDVSEISVHLYSSEDQEALEISDNVHKEWGR
jgi:GAF domain-containing protein